MITIDGYTDIVQIGQGGLGDVYRATRVSTGGAVAVKVLRDVSDESVLWHRTRRELTALVSLAGHANVIQLIELLELDQGPALVMEFAPGGSVADLMMRRDSTLSVGETVLVGRHTAAALVAAHAQGIVHRDIKPQNLLIDAYGQVKLCDFGVAALTRSEDFQARTSALSMRYASPEDLDDDVEVGPASDVYSLGATLLHLAHGAPPTLKERLAPWVPPPSTDADVVALDAAIAACLHPDPAERPTAGEVLDELDRLGWSVDERQRALAFEIPGGVEPAPDLPTDPRPGAAISASPAPDDAPTVAPASPKALDDPLDDPTVHRSGSIGTDRTDETPQRGEAPARPPASSPRERWKPWLILAVLAVLVAVPAFVLWPTDDSNGGSVDGSVDGSVVDEEPADTTVGTTIASTPAGTAAPADVDVALIARPAGLIDLRDESVVWPFGPIGDCLVQLPDDDELRPIGCDEPHDLQRVLVATLEGFPADAPYAEADSRTLVRRVCEVAFAEFTGVAFATSRLEAPFTLPSEESWSEGDRRYQCLLFAPGRRIVGDAAGSGS